MPSSAVESARSYSWARPRSSVQVTVVNSAAGRSGAGPLRQVSTSNPASVMSANRAGDQPPRSKHTVTRRPPPTTCRSWGSRRRTSPASESDGSATTMNTGSPSWSVTQVSIVAAAGNFSRATWVFCTCRVP
jgi:hypothetical protein